jgi:hypothetical protein
VHTLKRVCFFFLPLLIVFLCSGSSRLALHPIYVSVTEIEYQSKEKQLEISCRIFTNDLESVLKATNTQRIDLLNPAKQKEMEKLVHGYIREHLKLLINGKLLTLQYHGYEQVDDALQSYLTANLSFAPSNLTIINDLLFEYKSEQTNIVHITVNNKRTSRRLSNPEKQFDWKSEN